MSKRRVLKVSAPEIDFDNLQKKPKRYNGKFVVPNEAPIKPVTTKPVEAPEPIIRAVTTKPAPQTQQAPVIKPVTTKPTITTKISSLVKKCLLIGINYTGTDFALNGCINDSNNMRGFLVSNKYFSDSEITFMNDLQSGQLYPSKANIMAQFNEMVKFANDNASAQQILLFIAYSGHGTYVTDKTGDEKDSRDECLCPIDCDKSGYIVDDDIKTNLINKLGANVKLVFISDSCHSGSVLDLKYEYNLTSALSTVKVNNINDTLCSVILVSGCRDDQTSADAYEPDTVTKISEYQGAMTASFLSNFKDEINYETLIKNMYKWLSLKRYTQKPQLSSGQRLNLKSPFLLSGYN